MLRDHSWHAWNISSIRDQTGISHLQGKCTNTCIISLPCFHFLYFFEGYISFIFLDFILGAMVYKSANAGFHGSCFSTTSSTGVFTSFHQMRNPVVKKAFNLFPKQVISETLLLYRRHFGKYCLMVLFKKRNRDGEILQWVGCFPCIWPAHVQSPPLSMTPEHCQEWSLCIELG